jgi:hypothetical protein
VGTLAHYFEDEGIATTQISLVRPQSENARPPRALWVPFELGRPLGAPGDAAFQTRVLRAVLALLERNDGPVILDDYEEDAPLVVAAEAAMEGWACPINLPPPPADLDAGGGFRAALLDEIGRMTPWYDIALKDSGRTTVGLSGLEIGEIAELIAQTLDGTPPNNGSEQLKFAVDDLKAWYREAAAAQPGGNTGLAVGDWFYGETVAGKALFALYPILNEMGKRLDDPFMQTFGRVLLIPHAQRHRLES